MKKNYIAPCTETIRTISMQSLLEGSVTSSIFGIGYGGVDSEGSLDPASRRYRNELWDDEEDDF